MVMDPRFSQLPDSINGFTFSDEIVLPSFNEVPIVSNGLNRLADDRVVVPGFEQAPGLTNGFRNSIDDATVYPNSEQNNLAGGLKFKEDQLDLNFVDSLFLSPSPDAGNFTSSSSVSSELDSPDDHDSDPVLKYLNQILLEENLEDKSSMFHDPLALKAAEKSLYEVLGEKYPASPFRPLVYVDQNAESPESFIGSSSEYSTNSGTTGSSTDPQWIIDPGENKTAVVQNHPFDNSSQLNLRSSSEGSFSALSSFGNNMNSRLDSFVNTNLIPNIFSDSESILQFKRGMEEAKKFLPKTEPLIIDLDKYTLPPKSEETTSNSVVKLEEDERNSLYGSRGRKHHYQEDTGFEEERISKQSAVYEEEVELSEMFDRVLLCTDVKGEPESCNVDVESPGSESRQAGAKTRVINPTSNEAVDLRTLLISCAQSVAADDRRTANEQLKQIRQHASSTGDVYQRLANVFADGLEARLAGNGTELYAALASKKISAAEKLKAYQVYLSACPFKKISIFFANKMIMGVASKAETLHIIDFGILYGFQWPILIQHLSERPGGPPRLRITGIELPQRGFRPAERVEETGRRLAKYCERFKVPFEYQAIATQNWETIKVEDLKIVSGEVVAVNCLFRFKNLLDETVVVDSPRDSVLNLIRKLNPNIFVQSVINGSYSAPFFVTRFREALFHYSALFDMFDATIPRDNEHRYNFEQEFYGREAINVIACEGLERVERPETYKQWQIRNMRAGFKILPLNHELVKKLRGKVKAGYHRDFVFDEDSNWMLQGWKGRIICASSCWVPA